jgi:predicted Zn-dependent protease
MMGMYYEARGMIDKAQKIYKSMLLENPHDGLTYKRLAMMYVENDMANEGIEVLNKYLEVNMNDTLTWMQLADIYLQKQKYGRVF